MDFNSKIRIAIISDPHFYQQEKAQTPPSWLNINEMGEPQNLWKQLQDLITKENLSADVLLSLGDITTYANADALKVAWQSHVSLGEQMGCDILAAATGNHDVGSRPKEGAKSPREMEHATDLFENLKQLDPCYPLHVYNKDNHIHAHTHRVHYFGADFVIYDDDERFRLVVLNSCGRHTTEAKENERGRIAASTISWLDRELEKFSDAPKKINIAMCHHSPIPLEDNNSGTYDVIHNGGILLNNLNKCGDWVVCHGHKHFPKITHQNECFIFSSASLASCSVTADNQFYILDIFLREEGGLSCTVNAWNWFERKGWEKALSVKNGIWDGCGFGTKKHPEEIAKVISEISQEFPVDWRFVRDQISDLKFIPPETFNKTNRVLNNKYNLNIVCNENGPVEVARIMR
jgi:predicted phosphodiesterase